ncbi:hypothetical protein [Virgibacillus chiguensis]|uniref:Uncharacterized protein n=1 Tax=Virgibacillus chiguensis TaxID=411959 RepID=A0A1M5PH07_9BACI|nr:hypothetical protein [Virgibacillus chiguensis]SHH01055.1 hypothetical protein SAMN05421807_10363 [Virgibacillus chiguensis]
MEKQMLHQQLELATQQFTDAYELIQQAKTSGNEEELMQAQNQLLQVDHLLKETKYQAGQDALDNPQFQQTFEKLHNARQEIETYRQNNQ